MRVVTYVYDSTDADSYVEEVVERIGELGHPVDVIDVGSGPSTEDVRRKGVLRVKDAVRIGSLPDALFDDTGNLDFSAGALITEEPTGRRRLHVGEDALEAMTAAE